MSENDNVVEETVAEADPVTEVRRTRRSWPVEYKLQILEELDRAKAAGVRGEMGRVCRREGLYKSVVENWQLRRSEGALVGTTTTKRGPKPKDPAQVKIDVLTAEVAALTARLEESQELVAAQGKAFALLGVWCPKSA